MHRMDISKMRRCWFKFSAALLVGLVITSFCYANKDFKIMLSMTTTAQVIICATKNDNRRILTCTYVCMYIYVSSHERVMCHCHGMVSIKFYFFLTFSQIYNMKKVSCDLKRKSNFAHEIPTDHPKQTCLLCIFSS